MDEKQKQIKLVIQNSIKELSSGVVPWEPIIIDKKKEDAEKKKKDPWYLPEDSFRVLQRIILFPEEMIEERVNSLGWDDRSPEGDARKLLIKNGYIKLAGKLGKYEFFELTDKGKTWANIKNFTIPKFQSGVLHEVGVRRTEMGWGSTNSRISFKRRQIVNEIRLDSMAFLPDGIRVGIQVSHTNKWVYEQKAILKLLEEPSLDKILLVTTSKAKANKIAQALIDEAGEWNEDKKKNLDRVVIINAESIVKRDVNWKELMECAPLASP